MPFPRSAYDQTGGLVYFARMCHKMRLAAAGELPADYHELRGKGFDARTCAFLGVDYAELEKQVLDGLSDEAALDWCARRGQPISEMNRVVWNGFAIKRGLRDEPEVQAILRRMKEASGLGDRPDIDTFFEYFEVDEGRKK